MSGMDRSSEYRARPRTSAIPDGAVSAGTRRSGTRSHLRIVRIVIPFPRKAVPRLTTSNTTMTSLGPSYPIVNIHGAPPMNTPRFLESWLLRRPTVRRQLIEAFLEDKVLSPKERAVLDLIAMEDEEIAEYNLREVAADSLKRNGITDLTRRRFRDAGMVVDFAMERAKRAHNVVPIRQDARA